ncbi:MAG: class I SAM-dependent methyltransferase [Ferruginibacter sp.]
MSADNFVFGGSIPAKYDRYLGPFIFEPYAVHIAGMIKNNPLKLLEIAAGTGRVTKHILQQMEKEALLAATDLNPDMLAIAKEKVTAHNVEWMVADAQELPFADNSFDCVVCQFGFMFFPDKQKAFDEVFRVLKPGGQFLLNTWDRIENNRATYVCQQTAASFFQNDPPAFYKIPFSMFDPGEIQHYLTVTGFKNVQVDKVTLTGKGNAADIAAGFIEGNPIIAEITKENPSQVETIKTAAVAAISKNFGIDPVQCELNAWVAEAFK